MRFVLRPSRLILSSSALLASLAIAVGAQDSSSAKPGARILSGIVVDTAGNPIQDAEVTVPAIRARVFTHSGGIFRIDSVPIGTFQMRARKIGFAAQVRRFEIDSIGGFARFSLTPLVQGLPPMVSTAGRRGLSGTVLDQAMHAVPGASVRALGVRANARTDAEGKFFLPVESGRYMVSIAKDSFTTKLISVFIPPDSGRHVDATLTAGGRIKKEHYWNIEDLRERQAWRGPRDRILFTHEDLARMNIEWIYDAVAGVGPRLEFTEPISRDCMVVVDGGPEIANLATLTIDEVESVEVYRKLTGSSSPTVDIAAPQSKLPPPEILKNAPKVTGGQFIKMDNTRFAAFENRTRVCPGIYVWFR
jgi:hypothetical protein